MNKWRKILLGLAGLLTALAGYGVNDFLGGRQMTTITILNGATNVSTTAKVLNGKDASDFVCAVDFEGVPTSTIKFVGSVQETQPTFANAQSSTNQYEYLDVTDMQSGSSIDGDTGLSASTTADNRMVKIETRFVNWFSAVMVTSTGILSTGPVTVQCVPSNVR